jgi:hypothetical protein
LTHLNARGSLRMAASASSSGTSPPSPAHIRVSRPERDLTMVEDQFHTAPTASRSSNAVIRCANANTVHGFALSRSNMIDVEQRRNVGVFHLAHGKANALDVELCEAIAARLEAQRHSSMRALVLIGQRQIFSAGVDLLRVLDGGPPYRRAGDHALRRRAGAFPSVAVEANTNERASRDGRAIRAESRAAGIVVLPDAWDVGSARIGDHAGLLLIASILV